MLFCLTTHRHTSLIRIVDLTFQGFQSVLRHLQINHVDKLVSCVFRVGALWRLSLFLSALNHVSECPPKGRFGLHDFSPHSHSYFFVEHRPNIATFSHS